MKPILISYFLAVSLGGCIEEYDHKFNHGQCVQMRIDGLQGMVVARRMHNNGLHVRFAANTSITTDSFLGGKHDVNAKPYATVFVREFELIKCDDNT